MTTLDEYIVTLDRTLITQLSFVIALKDDYTNTQPLGNVNVMLKDQKSGPINNLDEYYCFLDIPESEVKIVVQSEYYFAAETEKIQIHHRSPQENPMEIRLQPGPSYPFPSGATLIRGLVHDSEGDAVSDAHVEVTGRTGGSKTTAKGEFVLYFPGLSENDILQEDHQYFLKGETDKTIQLTARYNSQIGTADLEYVEIGRMTSLKSPIIV